jgi:tetratricopeptide (TPR) repeat protein
LFRYILTAIAKVGCLAILSAAILWTVRAARGDHAFSEHTLSGWQQAVQIVPNQALYTAQLANQLRDTDPELAENLLERSLRLNPYAAPQWIQLGLWRETENNRAEAETDFLQAARVDSTFLPNWSLANYYFRERNEQQFWNRARKALQMTSKDASPIFRLSWLATNDASLVRSKLDIRRPEVLLQYLSYVITEGHIDAVKDASTDLIALNRKEDTNTLVDACNWLLDQNRPDAALAVWNGLATNHQIVFPRLSPTSGSLVTNNDFGIYPTSLGFDWHLVQNPGVRAVLNGAPPGLRLEFSGEQPVEAQLLVETIPLQPGVKYQITAEYSTSDISPGTGLVWEVEDSSNEGRLAATVSLSSDTKSTASICFVAPAQTSFAKLALYYRRSPGTERIRGRLLLRNIVVAPQPCSAIT